MAEDNVSDETTEAPQADATATVTTEPVAATTATEEVPLDAATAAVGDSTSVPSASGETAGTAVPAETAPTAEQEAALAAGETAAETAAEEETAFASVEDAVAEITRLRSENAAKRISNRELTEKIDAIQAKFGDAGEEFQQGWLELAEAFAANPDDPTVKAIFAELAGVQQENAPSLDENTIFEKVRGEFAAKQQQLDIQNIQNKLVAKARDLGYDPEATAESDPIAYASNQLLWAQVQSIPAEATDTETTRLEKADVAVKAYEQAVLDRKLAELSTANTGVPATSSAGVAEAQPGNQPPAGLTPGQKMKWAQQRSIELAEQQQSKPSF